MKIGKIKGASLTGGVTPTSGSKGLGKLASDNKNTTPSSKKQGGNSISDRDADGNILTEGQQTFFADSKIRNEEGNLIPVYHGTDANFSVFDRT
ncbi:MAG: hypothetical protein J5870_06170, partial [Clostridia bacterium]|nr:hypothetical protein [Clostridia bacterium]